MPPPKTSEVWNHFTCLDKKATCRYCTLSLVCNPRNGTGNLVRHLKRKHSNIAVYRESRETNAIQNIPLEVLPSTSAEVQPENEIRQETSAKSPTPALRQPPRLRPNLITSYTFDKRPLSSSKSKQIDNQLLKMIVKEYHPFSIVEDVEFRNLIHLLCPSYNIPTRKTVSASLVPICYNEVKMQMKALFQPTTAVSLTADGWTSQNNQHHFYAITAHFIDENTVLQNVLVDCIHYENRHTADNISKMLKDVLCEWGLQNNVIAIVTDNASNMLKAVRNLGWRQVRCTAHSLNLAVSNGLQQKEIKTIITKVKSIVEYFKRSSHALCKLKENQKKLDLPVLKLKQDCITRWNSTYDMLNRFFSTKNAIITTLAIENPGLNTLSVEEWEVISKCIEILQVFHIVTESLCSEKHVSLSYIPIYVRSMMENLSKHMAEQRINCIKELCLIIKNEIQDRFGDIEKHELVAQATVLDPRIKSHGLSPENAEKAIKDLKQMCAKIKLDSEPQDHPETNLEEPEEDSHQLLVWGSFDRKVKSLLAPQNATASSIIEVDKYLNEVLLDRKQDPLIWWKQRKDIYPRLYKIMTKRLCITATSVPCERVFSKMGQIINDRRSRLKPEKSSKIMFLAHNLK